MGGTTRPVGHESHLARWGCLDAVGTGQDWRPVDRGREKGVLGTPTSQLAGGPGRAGPGRLGGGSGIRDQLCQGKGEVANLRPVDHPPGQARRVGPGTNRPREDHVFRGQLIRGEGMRVKIS